MCRYSNAGGHASRQSGAGIHVHACGNRPQCRGKGGGMGGIPGLFRKVSLHG
jgi:hypothetical protein